MCADKTDAHRQTLRADETDGYRRNLCVPMKQIRTGNTRVC